MGTRGVVGFVSDGKWYVTYNHMDSYPSCLGMDVLEFCKTVENWDAIKSNLKKLVSDVWVEGKKFPEGEEFLEKVEDGSACEYEDYSDFMGDSLFCEWGYIIDLDEEVLNVYKGNQIRPYPDNVLPPEVDRNEEDGGYYPVRLLYSYDLNSLPEFMLGVTNEFKQIYRLNNGSPNLKFK